MRCLQLLLQAVLLPLLLLLLLPELAPLLLLLQQGLQLRHQQPPALQQLQLPLQHGALLAVDGLQPFADAAPLLHGGLQIRHPLAGQAQLLGGIAVALQGEGQGAAGLDASGGGVARRQSLLQLRQHALIQARGHGIGAATPLQLLHQPAVVVALLAALERIVAGVALPHPEVGPALRQLGDAAPLHRGVVPQQLREALLSGGAAQGWAAAATQLAGATGPGEAFAQLPQLPSGLEADLDVGQPGMGA